MSSYTIYVYGKADFVQPLPAETTGGRFPGLLPFTLTLKPQAVPVRLTVSERDIQMPQPGAAYRSDTSAQFSENAITLNGVTWPAGTQITPGYTLYTPGNPLRMISLSLGEQPYGGRPNAPEAVILTGAAAAALAAGQAQIFTNAVSADCDPIRDPRPCCYASGTHIATPDGEVRVEALVPGQLIQTLDHGLQPLRQVLATTVSARADAAPVVIAAKTCGNQRDLVLSPQQRVLFSGSRAAALFGESEVLVAAQHLVGAGLARQRHGRSVTFYQLVFDQHEIIFAEGAACESPLPAPAENIADGNDKEASSRQTGAARLCLKADQAKLLLLS
ncbi:Hint domain-containing protein [Xinfangfangia sp. D13-10-4-6]|uniref:Hint domain-containing protein n=1 Tax=Pseudogemmobacter hezensis TaxID=2737662 RepID=UPI0015520F20|nr:Hint domain-containing protein [Pseudogemmobacter hezensis]NPD16179.1 Hint domain-containing protein [Pseudogemmobacter hezensis]